MEQGGHEYPFSADRPINSGSEDLLGRAKFAASLGKAIKSWKGKDSLVVALYGPWGSGKSSVKNLALENLRASPSDCPSILEFNPWQLASQSQITETFFSEVGTVLGRIDTSANASRLAAKFYAYGRYISTGRFVANGIKRFFISILAVSSVVGFVGFQFELHLFVVIMAGVAALVAVVLGFSSKLFDLISDSFQAEAKSKTRTIPEMKAELTDMLASLQRPLLIVLDDIDRLSGDELKLLFQLLKGNADFPNLIYLLLLSLDHVQKALEPMDGKEYMEKIVQIGFEMPRVERSQIHQLVGHEIEKVLSAHGSIAAFTSEIERWRSIYSLGAHVYFKTIRDVRRFASVLAFQLSHFTGGSILEINVVDLTALQIIALFEPKLYQAIFSSKQQLVGAEPSTIDGLAQSVGRGVASESVLDELVAHASNENRAYARMLLVELFPRLPYGQSSFSREDEQWASTIQSLRICHAGFFDRYFLFSIPQNDLSEGELHSIISTSTDRGSLIKDILSVTQRGLFDILFERLEAHAGKLDLGRAVDILTALFDVGDMLPKIETSFYIALPEERIAQLASTFISRELDVSKQQQILLQSVQEASGIYVPLLTCNRLFHASSRATSANFDVYLKEAQHECLKKIKHASEVGTLKSHKSLIHILRYWNGMGGPESGVRPWVSGLILDQEALINFLYEMSSKVMSNKGRFLRTNVESVTNFVSLEELEERISSCLGQSIGAEDKILLNAWIEGLSYRKSASGQGGSGYEVEFKLVEK